jgi:cytochrome c oxidase subunit 3
MSHNHEAAVEVHAHRDDVGAKMGMWLFLFTEILLFGGMFLAYAVYRYQYPEQFHLAAMELNTGIGTLNTIILLTSSLTVALSIAAMQKGNRFLSIVMLAVTDLFALMFMVNKFFEWSAKFEHGIYPGSEELLAKPKGKYYSSDLLCNDRIARLHVIIGVVLLKLYLFSLKNKITRIITLSLKTPVYTGTLWI